MLALLNYEKLPTPTTRALHNHRDQYHEAYDLGGVIVLLVIHNRLLNKYL